MTEYDLLIKDAAARYLPGIDWRLLKAQIWQESRFKPTALSPAGAMGLAQFMPDTWREMKQKMSMPTDASAYDPQYAIPACAFYMMQLHEEWRAPRPPIDRYCLTLASYNAGMGSIVAAQRKAEKIVGRGNANSYAIILLQLPNITGHDNAKETRDYVVKIWSHYISQVTGVI